MPAPSPKGPPVFSPMKLAVPAAFLLAALCFAPSAQAGDPIFRIDVGRRDREFSREDLQRRVWELERAVAQLQRRVFELEATPVVVAPPPEKPWTCILVANMKGTFTSTQNTRGEAYAHVLQQCGDTFWCKGEDVTCSQ